MPTQEDIESALEWFELHEKHDSQGRILAAAYRAEKERNDCQNRHMDRGDRLLANERDEIARGHALLEKAEARAELAERQYGELRDEYRRWVLMMQDEHLEDGYLETYLARHEAERKSLV